MERNWFAPQVPRPAPDPETMFRRLAAQFGSGPVRRLRRAMEDGARSEAFYRTACENPALSAALAMAWDGESLPRFAAFLWERRRLFGKTVLDAGCGNGLLTAAAARMAPDSAVLGVDRCAEAAEAARALRPGDGVSFGTEWPERVFDTVLSVRTLHENFDQSGVAWLETLEEAGERLAGRMEHHARRLTARVAEDGVLISLERCRADAVLLGWLSALGRCGFAAEEVCGMEAAECGRPAQFHALVLRRGRVSRRELLERFCAAALPPAPGDCLEGAAAEAYLLRRGGCAHYGFSVSAPDGAAMGRGGVWAGGEGKILVFQASPAGRFLRIWPAGRLDAAVEALRASARQAREAGYTVEEGENAFGTPVSDL